MLASSKISTSLVETSQRCWTSGIMQSPCHRGRLPSTLRSQPPTPRPPSSPMSSSPTRCYRQLSCSTLPLCRPTPRAPFPSRPTAAPCLCLAFPPALWTHPLHERFSTPSVRSMPHSPPANAPLPQPPRVLLLVRLLPTSICTEQLLPHDRGSAVLPAGWLHVT